MMLKARCALLVTFSSFAIAGCAFSPSGDVNEAAARYKTSTGRTYVDCGQSESTATCSEKSPSTINLSPQQCLLDAAKAHKPAQLFVTEMGFDGNKAPTIYIVDAAPGSTDYSVVSFTDVHNQDPSTLPPGEANVLIGSCRGVAGVSACGQIELSNCDAL